MSLMKTIRLLLVEVLLSDRDIQQLTYQPCFRGDVAVDEEMMLLRQQLQPHERLLDPFQVMGGKGILKEIPSALDVLELKSKDDVRDDDPSRCL